MREFGGRDAPLVGQHSAVVRVELEREVVAQVGGHLAADGDGQADERATEVAQAEPQLGILRLVSLGELRSDAVVAVRSPEDRRVQLRHDHVQRMLEVQADDLVRLSRPQRVGAVPQQ